MINLNQRELLWYQYIKEVNQHPWYLSFKETQSIAEIDILKQLLFCRGIKIKWTIKHSSVSENHYQLYVNFASIQYNSRFYLETGTIDEISSIIKLLTEKNTFIEKFFE